MESRSQKTEIKDQKSSSFLSAILLALSVVLTLSVLIVYLLPNEKEEEGVAISLPNARLLNDRVLQLVTYSSAEEYVTLKSYFVDKMTTALYQEYFSADPSDIISRKVSVKQNPTGYQKVSETEFIFKTEIYLAYTDNLIELVVLVTVANGLVTDIQVY